MDQIEVNSLIQAAKEHFRTNETELPAEISCEIEATIEKLFRAGEEKPDDLPALKEIVKISNSLIKILELHAKRLNKRIKSLESRIRED